MQHQSDKIKIVVFNEHTIGFQRPDSKYIEVLHASILKGAPFELYPDSKYIGTNDKIRLANEQDFHEYRIEFTQFASRPEEYEIQR